MIRNSFSHVGRVKVSDYYLTDSAYVFLNDYDESGNISGLVKTRYFDLIQLLCKGVPDVSYNQVSQITV